MKKVKGTLLNAVGDAVLLEYIVLQRAQRPTFINGSFNLTPLGVTAASAINPT